LVVKREAAGKAQRDLLSICVAGNKSRSFGRLSIPFRLLGYSTNNLQLQMLLPNNIESKTL
jgi:hypothetical protein